MKHKNERKVDKIGEDGASQEKKEKSTKKRKKVCESTNTWQSGTRTHNITTKNRQYILLMDVFYTNTVLKSTCLVSID